MAFDINALFMDPQRLAMLTGGLNMMAAARGGNPDLTKGGLGYGLMQGLQGAAQGMQMSKGMQDQERARQQEAQKQKMMDDYLMKLNLSPSAMQSTGVMQPGVQQSALTQLSPEQKEIAKMAIMSGDWKSVAQMIAPGEGMTPYQRESLDLQRRRLDMQNQGMTDYQRQALELRNKALENQRMLAEQRGEMMKGSTDIKKQQQASALNEELINLQGVLADVNRAEELLTTGGNVTGPAIGLTPSISETAQELESLTQALGIGRLQQFKGATSEKELAAALRSGLSMKADKQPNLNRLKAQREIIERNIKRITGMLPKVAGTSVPEGVPTDVWDVMTDDERAAWQ